MCTWTNGLPMSEPAYQCKIAIPILWPQTARNNLSGFTPKPSFSVGGGGQNCYKQTRKSISPNPFITIFHAFNLHQLPPSPCVPRRQSWGSYLYHLTNGPPKINDFVPENRDPFKQNIIFQPSIFRGNC